jgi:hypothetical protein
MYSTTPIHWNIKSAQPAQAEDVLGQLSMFVLSLCRTKMFALIYEFSSKHLSQFHLSDSKIKIQTVLTVDELVETQKIFLICDPTLLT